MNPLLKDHVLDAIEGAVEGMRTSSHNPIKAVFDATAVFGALSRAFNVEYDTHLAYAHFVIQHATMTIGNQISKIVTGQERALELRVDILLALADAFDAFGERIRSDEPFYEELERIGEIAYAATGNGFYLYERGRIKLGGPSATGSDEFDATDDSVEPVR